MAPDNLAPETHENRAQRKPRPTDGFPLVFRIRSDLWHKRPGMLKERGELEACALFPVPVGLVFAYFPWNRFPKISGAFMTPCAITPMR